MVLALNLGGTIALSYVEDRPVPLSGRQVLKNCRIEIREIAPVQSYALEWTHVLRTRDEINLAYADGERRFMVLTGTDSAEDLIYLLDMLRPSDAAVVVLVSMLYRRDIGSPPRRSRRRPCLARGRAAGSGSLLRR